MSKMSNLAIQKQNDEREQAMESNIRYFKVLAEGNPVGAYSVGVENGMVVDIDDHYQVFLKGDFTKFVGWVIKNFKDVEVIEQICKPSVESRR